MKTFEKYINNIQYCWYDSSNTLFSKCYDNPGDLKVIKIIFKGGRTYLYKDVDVTDYVAFRDAASNGTAFSKYIKKYVATRIQDTDLNELAEMKSKFMDESDEIQETKISDLDYVIEYCERTGDFDLKLGDSIIYHGIEGQVSIINLFKSMGINAIMKPVEKFDNSIDEERL